MIRIILMMGIIILRMSFEDEAEDTDVYNRVKLYFFLVNGFIILIKIQNTYVWKIYTDRCSH